MKTVNPGFITEYFLSRWAW